jgi:hypothetical protein
MMTDGGRVSWAFLFPDLEEFTAGAVLCSRSEYQAPFVLAAGKEARGW